MTDQAYLYVTESLRLFPTPVQEAYFNRAASLSCHVYNKALDWDKEIYSRTKKFATEQELIVLLKEYSTVINDGRGHGLESHTWREGIFRYLDARKHRFTVPGTGFPKYQTNKGRLTRSFYVREDNIRIFTDGYISVPGMSKIDPNHRYVRSNLNNTRLYQSRPKRVRIVFDGKYWFLRVAVEVPATAPETRSDPVGVDLGLKAFAVTSDGKSFTPYWEDEKYNALVKRKKGLQRSLAVKREQGKIDGKYTPTKNYFKTLDKLHHVERAIAEVKKAKNIAIAKSITEDNPSAVVMETLDIKQMLQNKYHSRRIHEAGWYNLLLKIKWEQEKDLNEFIQAPKTFPSTRRCSECGNVKSAPLPVSVRVYTCAECGFSCDRDLNAARNLELCYS